MTLQFEKLLTMFSILVHLIPAIDVVELVSAVNAEELPVLVAVCTGLKPAVLYTTLRPLKISLRQGVEKLLSGKKYLLLLQRIHV